MRRHLSAVAVGVAPLVAGSINNATRPAGESRIPVTGMLLMGAVFFILAEAISREPTRGEPILASVAIAATIGVVGGAMIAFAAVGLMLAFSHGDPRVIEGHGAVGMAIVRQWWVFSAVVFLVALAASARVIGTSGRR